MLLQAVRKQKQVRILMFLVCATLMLLYSPGRVIVSILMFLVCATLMPLHSQGRQQKQVSILMFLA